MDGTNLDSRVSAGLLITYVAASLIYLFIFPRMVSVTRISYFGRTFRLMIEVTDFRTFLFNLGSERSKDFVDSILGCI